MKFIDITWPCGKVSFLNPSHITAIHPGEEVTKVHYFASCSWVGTNLSTISTKEPVAQLAARIAALGPHEPT